eukprot:TRINITY_DN2626_c0_g1_i1.p1 TRINITY_DN2626_c0_g1~~TRINITY_DN2626_c0_g1_i1.p1  ORF type:complete len:268 (-),score=61.36 TRINITY_DN2626_c0_g1_i1:298-1101(-)
MIRRPPRSTQSRSSAASDVYKRQVSTQSTGGQDFPMESTIGREGLTAQAPNEAIPGSEEAAPEIEVEVCIVGGKFATCPLIRELERTGTSYVVVDKDAPSIWESLEQAGIDFDLVSSQSSSYYSFGLGEVYEGSYFPMGSEFLAFQRKWFSRIHDRSKFISDEIILVEHTASSVMCTSKAGRRVRAKFAVIGTAFTRAVRSQILTLDHTTINNQVVLFDGFGDSGKLLMSRLLGRGNKFYVLTDGFGMQSKNFVCDNKALFVPIETG